MKTIAKRFLSSLLGIGVIIAAGGAAAAPQTVDPQGESAMAQRPLAAGPRSVPSYRRNLDTRYSPLYRSRLLEPSDRIDALGRSYQYRPSYRFSLPLNRSGVYRSWPPNYYRRVTPYYDGRGYGVPSTSPFRYRQDLDGRIRSRR